MKTFLHVGCGGQNKTRLKGFSSDEWSEIRFDIDKSVSPDIVGTLTDMSLVKSGSVDAIYSSHNIEHIYPHEVPLAFKEFHRVLKADGIVVMTCPDLQSVCEVVANDRLVEPLYISPAGPITPLDILFGHIKSMFNGHLFMAHKGGFTFSSLRQCFFAAGFTKAVGFRRPKAYDLWLVAFKQNSSDENLKKIATEFLP